MRGQKALDSYMYWTSPMTAKMHVIVLSKQKEGKLRGTGSIPDAQGEVMIRVRLAVAFNGGRPLSQTRKGTRSTVPTGKVELMPQFCKPTLANSCPARHMDPHHQAVLSECIPCPLQARIMHSTTTPFRNAKDQLLQVMLTHYGLERSGTGATTAMDYCCCD